MITGVDEHFQNLISLVESANRRYEIHSIGKSKNGEDIICITILGMHGESLLLGFPHPDEPLSEIALNVLFEHLDDDDFSGTDTWHVIPVWDVDGARKNESSWIGPLSIENFIKRKYRTAACYQVEWDFPLSIGAYVHRASLPETIAVKSLIDEVHPKRLVSMHSAAISDALVFCANTSRGMEYAFSRALCEHFGSSVAKESYTTSKALGVFEAPLARREYQTLQAYDEAEGYGSGASSYEYAGDSCIALVSELPIFGMAECIPERLLQHISSDALVSLWRQFQKDLIRVFDGANAEDISVGLSLPFEYYQRPKSDFSYVVDRARKLDELVGRAKCLEYFVLLYPVACQYARIARETGMPFLNGETIALLVKQFDEFVVPIEEATIKSFALEIFHIMLGRL